MSGIHPTAIIDPKAELASDVTIGPYAVVGPQVRLGPGVELRPHALVTGNTEVGAETVIYSFASVGEIPQDQKYRGESTRLVIGARNTRPRATGVRDSMSSGLAPTLPTWGKVKVMIWPA